jgi:transcriptional regulator with XRE-family HTH domain
MARLKGIEETVDLYLKTLLEFYRDTDPAKGPDDQYSKHAMAELAIERFWYLQGKLMSWAQAHMTGYAILCETPGLSEFLENKLGHEIDEDSHVLEQIGLVYNYNPPDCEDPELLRVHDLLEEFADSELGDNERLLGPQAMRRFIVELLMSRCADNSYWRFDLQSSLRALNEGETDVLATPLRERRQGKPFTLNQWKLEALRQVHFRVGGGIKKYRALEEVGDAIGQSPETLRAWEKSLRRSPDRDNDLYCSELAGQFKDSLDGKPLWELEQLEEYGWHRGTHNLARTRLLYKVITELSLDEIRQRISHYRQKESGG